MKNKRRRFVFFKQLNSMDCGPTCLRMIAKFYGKNYTSDFIRKTTGYGKVGVSLGSIANAAHDLGFETSGTKLNVEQLLDLSDGPSILHWEQNHFVVLIPSASNSKYISIADPGKGILRYTREEFAEKWTPTHDVNNGLGIALLLTPTDSFYVKKDSAPPKLAWGLITRYLSSHKTRLSYVIWALLLSSVFQLIFPFFTQSIIDVGIKNKDLNYITLVLIAQLGLIFSRTFVEFIRTRLLLDISSILNLSILSDFWIKLTKLPLSYFETHLTGDTIQRLDDNKQVQNFLTGSAIGSIFSVFSLLIYSIILIYYNIYIFLVFFIGSGLYFIWIYFFLNVRRKINYQVFDISSRENNATLQLIQGMSEIRINNAENPKRWQWEDIQVKIFKLHFKGLNYSQLQESGAMFINQIKDIIITFFVANLVVKDILTLGSMLAIQYIIGQLNSPVEQLVNFIQKAQDAKLSMERLNEVHDKQDEEQPENSLKTMPQNLDIKLKNISFNYPGPINRPVLSNINLCIPQGKITAIVGVSGSGKTTLLRLLLKFYDSYSGDIEVGHSEFKSFSHSFWRSKCGAVLQEGYIFNDTIAGNITVGNDFDSGKLSNSCKIANILSFVESFPNGFHTILGSEGISLSQGQKQRILMARAIYKDPLFLFLDEATNALDANNEKQIVENLENFFIGKTVVIVAHRLSTVKNADQIVVLHEGAISEIGTHKSLSANKGLYYELVKNQLELGQ